MIHDDQLEKLSEQFEQGTVLEELNALPENIRAPLVMRYLQGKSNGEVADELQLSLSAVEGRLKRGRNQLRLRLARNGVAFTVCIGMMNHLRGEAAAAEMTHLVAETVQHCTTSSTTSSCGLENNEAIRLAEQEISKMMMTRITNGFWATVASICVVATGIGLTGTAIGLAQSGDAFGNGNSAVEADPFGGEIIQADTTRPTSDDLFDVPLNVATQKSSSDSSAATTRPAPTSNEKSPWQRMRDLGHYGIGSESEEEIRILEALEQMTNLELIEEPVRNVADLISQMHNIPIVFDRRALEDDGIDPDSDTVSIDLRKIRLRSAMNIALDQLDMAMLPRNDVLMITTKAAAEEQLTTRLYKIPKGWLVAENELKKSIQAVVHPDSWDEVGGPGTIQLIPTGLIVSNTHDTHRGIDKLFTQLEMLYAEEAQTRLQRADSF